MINNVKKITETAGTIYSSHSNIDGPTPNGTNEPQGNAMPDIAQVTNVFEGRTWATMPTAKAQIATSSQQPITQPREQQPADAVDGQA